MNELFSLWKLIQSLNTVQKRELSKAIDPGLAYGQVYFALARSSQYNDRLEKRILGYFTHPRSVYQALGKIYDIVVDTLYKKQAASSLPGKLAAQYATAEVCYQIGFFDRCDKLLLELEAHTRQSSALELLEKTLALRQRLILKHYTLEQQRKALADNLQRYEEAVLDREALRALQMVERLLQIWLRDQYIMAADPQELAPLAERLAGIVPRSALGIALATHCKATLAFLQRDFALAETLNQEAMAYFDAHPMVREMYPEEFFSVLHHAVRLAYWQIQAEKGLSLIAQYAGWFQQEHLGESMRLYIWASLRLYELLLLEQLCRLDEALETEPIIKDFLQKHADKLEPSLHYLFFYTFASIWASKGAFAKAKKYLVPIHSKSYGEVRPDMYLFTLHSLCLMSMLADDAEMVTHWQQQLKKHYAKHNPFFELEGALQALPKRYLTGTPLTTLRKEMAALAAQPPSSHTEQVARNYVLYFKAQA